MVEDIIFIAIFPQQNLLNVVYAIRYIAKKAKRNPGNEANCTVYSNLFIPCSHKQSLLKYRHLKAKNSHIVNII